MDNVIFQHLQTPLHLAVKNGYIPVIHTLLVSGCDTDITDHVSHAALLVLCMLIRYIHRLYSSK